MSNPNLGPHGKEFYNAAVSTAKVVNNFTDTIDGAIAAVAELVGAESLTVINVKKIWEKMKPGALPADACEKSTKK